MMRGEMQYFVVKKQEDQADPLLDAPISMKFDTLDNLQRGIVDLDLDKFEIFEVYGLAARVEKKVILGGPAPSANIA